MNGFKPAFGKILAEQKFDLSCFIYKKMVRNFFSQNYLLL